MKLQAIMIKAYLGVVLFFISQSIFCITNTWTVPGVIPGLGSGRILRQVVMDGRGNAYTVGGEDLTSVIRLCRFSVETQTWTAKTIGTGFLPWISVDSAGNAIVVWIHKLLSNDYELMATYYNVSQSLEQWVPVNKIVDVITLVSGILIVESNLQAAISDNGTAIIAWGWPSGDFGTRLYRATLYDNSQDWNSWNPNSNLKTNFPSGYGHDFASVPVIVMDREGNAIFKLLSPYEEPLSFYAVRYENSMNWNEWDPSLSLKKISDDGAGRMVINSQGNAAFVWIEFPDRVAIATFYDKIENWNSWIPVLKNVSFEQLKSASLTINDSNNVIFLLSGLSDVKVNRYDGSGWNSWIPPLPSIITPGAVGALQVQLDNNGNAATTFLINKDNEEKLQATLYDVKENLWKQVVDISYPFIPPASSFTTSPAVAIWKQNPDNTSIKAMAGWSLVLVGSMFTQTLTPPPLNLLDVQPGVNTAVSSGSDSSGNIHVGVLGQGTASLLSHNPEDPANVWSLRQVSDPTHNVDQLALGVNVDNNTAVAYINNASDQGQAWVVLNENSPELISTATENARDIAVAISNNVQVAEVHVSTKVSGENLGEISVNLFDPIAGQYVNKIVSSGPGALPQIASSGLGSIYVTWILNDGVNSKIQAAYAPYNSLINQWVWQNNIDISITGSVGQPRVVVDSLDNNAIFAWKEWDGSNWRINSAWYDGYTNWNTWAHTTTYLSPEGFDADNLSIFMDSAGNASVVWQFFDGVDTQIQAARFDSQTKQWTLPTTTKGIPQTISPVGATRPNVSLAKQGDGIVSYNVGKQTYYNLWNFDSQTFGPATNTGFPSGLLASSLCVANWNGTVRGVVNTVGLTTRQNGDEKIWVTLPKGSADVKPAAPIVVRSMQELHRFPLQADLVNVIRWQAGDNTAVRYEIYADSTRIQLIGIILAECPLEFCHHCRQPGISTTYYLFAVNAAGKYSDPAEIIVP